MGPRIALLLSGEPEDLPATICAVQLAARSDSKLYAIQDFMDAGQDESAINPNDDTPSIGSQLSSSFTFVVEFAGSEGVQTSCHLLDNRTIEQMAEFLTTHHITCLVVNKSKKNQEGQASQLTELQHQLTESLLHLQIITAPLWEDMDIKQVVRQCRRLGCVNMKNE